MTDKIHRSRISNTEWGLVIGGLLLVDIIQIVLDVAFQIGVIANRFIDVVVGGAFAFYLQVRGEKLSDPKRLIALIFTFLGEEVPEVDALPFWSLDGVYNFHLARQRNKAVKKHEEEEAKMQQQQKIRDQREKILRLEQIRQQQNEDLYDEAA